MVNPPNPLDYRPPRLPDDGPRRGSVPMFIAGVFAGLGLSFVGWSLGLRAGNGNVMILTILVLITIKVVVGVAVDQQTRRRGFLPGIIFSIPLVPLLALGTLAVLCGGFRFN